MAASPLFYGTSTLRFVALFLVLFGFVNKCYSHVRQDTLLYETEEDTCATKDFILCRKCGADVVDAGYIVNNLSPKAKSVTNQTVFHSSGVQVQRLVNPFGITFKTVALTRANCIGATEHWNLLYSWYPGYAWKACLCRRCGYQLGWMFEPISSATPNRLAPTKNGFYLLILDSTLSEKYHPSGRFHDHGNGTCFSRRWL